MKNSMSAVVITYNVGWIINECLDALSKITDDIVIVDSHSSDGTASKCKEKGARVFQRKWHGYGEAKNFGVRQCLSDWIISVDADEVLSEELIACILNLDLNPERVYALDRITSLFGKWIHHSGWYPDWVIRIYHRDKARWDLALVHERLEYDSMIRITKLDGKLWHYSYPDHQTFYSKQEKYARLGAQQRHQRGSRSWWIMRFLGPLARFMATFIFKHGFLDGRPGWFISVQQARTVHLRHRYLMSLNKGERLKQKI